VGGRPAAGDPVNFSDPFGLSPDTLKYDGKEAVLVDDNGKERWRGTATSGRPGSTSQDQSEEDVGPIPQGMYTLDPSQISTVSGLRYLARNLLGDWGYNRVGLTPFPVNAVFGRSGFMLHGGKIPGSAGCIDVGSGEATLFPLLKAHKGPITVKVNYNARF
jgi:hypothetical protein